MMFLWVDLGQLFLFSNLVNPSFTCLSPCFGSKIALVSFLLPLNALKLGNISFMKLWTSSSTALDSEDILAVMLKKIEKLFEF
jgi:hypothetical protein